MPRRRHDLGAGDLEALDPVTGAPIDGGADPAGAAVGFVPPQQRRRRRLHLVRVVCVVLSLASAGAAVGVGSTARSLREVERTWRTAMAVDRVRADAYRRVVVGLASFDDEQSSERFLIAIGSEAGARLGAAEEALEDRRAGSGRLGDLRDRMVDALRERRLQLAQGRRRLDDRRITAAEDALAEELRRFRLAPTSVPEPRLASAEQALERLRRFADAETGATVVAVRGVELVVVDVDRSVVSTRPLSGPASGLVAVGADMVAVVGSDIEGHGVRSPEPGPRWRRPGVAAFGAGGVAGVWIDEGTSVVRVDVDGAVTAGPFPTPAGASVVGAMGDALVLATGGAGAGATRRRDLERWDPTTDGRVVMARRVSRFIGSTDVALLAEVTGADDDALVHWIDRSGTIRDRYEFPTDVTAVAQHPNDDDELATVLGPLAGRIASVQRLRLQGRGAFVTRPRAASVPGALAWAPSGEALFWLTPDGAIALHRPDDRTSQPLRAPLRDLERIVTLRTPK